MSEGAEEFLKDRLDQDGIMCMEGFIFLKASIIKDNVDIVQKTFKELYRFVSKN